MRAFVIAALFSSANSLKLVQKWPSVARCDGILSTDQDACDHNNNLRHNHDGVYGSLDYVQQKVEWPSVARCDGILSTDQDACDHNNNLRHNHDGVYGSLDYV